MAWQVLLQLQELEEEDKQLIEIGRQQRVSVLDFDEIIKAYHELNSKINDLMPQA